MKELYSSLFLNIAKFSSTEVKSNKDSLLGDLESVSS